MSRKKTNRKPSYCYGPVPSRRLGLSLGIDLIPPGKGKICPFNCVYCQLGAKGLKTDRRFSYAKINRLKNEVRAVLKKNPQINYLTLSGSGEPTLHKNLDKIIAALKTVAHGIPICLITNSALFYRKPVRNQVRSADLIMPSLDAAFGATFAKINQPLKNVTLRKVIKGLIALREEFKGKIWLEIMLAAGINDSLKEAGKFKQIAAKINPDKILLNLPVRSPDVLAPSRARLEQIKKILGNKAEIVGGSKRGRRNGFSGDIEDTVLKFLQRRPASSLDLAKALGIAHGNLKRCLSALKSAGKVKQRKNLFFHS